MWTDEIVEDVRKVRDAYAATFNYDIEAICEDLKKQAALAKRKTVSLPPKQPIQRPHEQVS